MPHELCQQLPLEDKENDATYDTMMKRSTMYLLTNPKRLVIMDIGHWNAAQTDTRMGKRTTVEVKMKQDVENCMRSKATANIKAYQILLNGLVIAVASIVKHTEIVLYERGTCIPNSSQKGKTCGRWCPGKATEWQRAAARVQVFTTWALESCENKNQIHG